jgi:hypothetical protein
MLQVRFTGQIRDFESVGNIDTVFWMMFGDIVWFLVKKVLEDAQEVLETVTHIERKNK